MFKKISVVTILSATLLFAGIMGSSVSAAANSNQSEAPSYSNNVYYFSISDNWASPYHFFNRYTIKTDKKSWLNKRVEKKEQPKAEKKEEKPRVEEPQEQPKAEEPQDKPKVEQPTKEDQVVKEEPQRNDQTDQLSQYEQQVVELTNNERTKQGLEPLQADWELSRVAREKSHDMQANGYFAHNSPVYGSPFDMMKAYGITYRSAGENIARGQRTPEEVVNAWMNSPGHRANILKADFTHLGVGFVEQGNYWTQQFIGK